MDPQLSVVSNPDMSMDMEDDQAQDLTMASVRSNQSDGDIRERDTRTSQSSDVSSDLSPTSSVVQHPSL